MATNIFGGLTAAVLALSIWMGFKNKAEFDKQIEFKKSADRELKASQQDLANVTEKYNTTVEEKEQKIADNDAAKQKLATTIDDISTTEGEIASGKNELVANRKEIARVRAVVDDVMKDIPDPDMVIQQIKTDKQKIASLESEIASEEQKIADLGSEENSVNSVIAAKREDNQLRASGKSLPTLSTTVQSVYPNWGFVTLNGGDAQGVVSGSLLDVLRDGEVVAKLKVTAVESNRAAADILPDAVPGAVALQVGDRVVAEQTVAQ